MLKENHATQDEALVEADAPDSDKDLGRQILEHVQDGYKVGHDHFVAAGLKLIDAKSRLKGGFNKFLKTHCNGLSPSWAYDLIKIAKGEGAEVRANNKERSRRFRAKAPKLSVAQRKPTPSQTAVEPPRDSNVVNWPAQPAQNKSQWAVVELKDAINIYVPFMDAAAKLDVLDYLTAEITPTKMVLRCMTSMSNKTPIAARVPSSP